MMSGVGGGEMPNAVHYLLDSQKKLRQTVINEVSINVETTISNEPNQLIRKYRGKLWQRNAQQRRK
jgi:hypothetical protein